MRRKWRDEGKEATGQKRRKWRKRQKRVGGRWNVEAEGVSTEEAAEGEADAEERPGGPAS